MAPSSTATMELATPSDRLWWAWMPICGPRLQHVAVGADAVSHVAHRQPSAGVGDIDAVRAVALHQLGLRGERVGLDHVAHHQEAGHVHAQVAGGGDVLRGDVRLGAVGGDAHRA